MWSESTQCHRVSTYIVPIICGVQPPPDNVLIVFISRLLHSSQANIQCSVPGSDLPRIVEDSALPCDSTRQLPAGDHDADRPSTCHEDFTRADVSPNEDTVGPTEDATPRRTETECDNLSLTSQHLETVRDAPQETPMTYLVAPPSPMKPGSKRRADAASDDEHAPAKRGRTVPSRAESSRTLSNSSSTRSLGTGVSTRTRSKALQASRVKDAAGPSRRVLRSSESGPSKEKPATLRRGVNKPVSAESAPSRSLTSSTGERNRQISEARQVIGSDASTSREDSARPGDSFNLHATSTSKSGCSDSDGHHERATRSTSALNDRHGHMSKSIGVHAPTRLVRRCSVLNL